MSTFVWAAMPAGLTGGPEPAARIRVLVVPRLAAGSLADFGLQDWPSLLADATFDLEVRTADGIREAEHALRYDPVADSDAWHAFFDADAGVVEEWTPTEQPAPQVGATYADARAVVMSYRECTSILTREPTDGEDAVRRRIDQWKTPLPPSAQPEPPLPPLPPDLDFHRTVATLREHPTVLEALGLVFELRADRADLDIGTGPRFLRIRGTDLPIDISSPWTKYDLTGTGFWPAPANGSSGIRNGLLDLAGVGLLDWAEGTAPPWALSLIDVDGAVRALRTEARALDADSSRRPVLPDLRTGGLMLIRPDRQSDFTARAGVAAGRLGAGLHGAELTAEDLVLGYRVDIRTGDDEQWHPLCTRRASYTVEDADGQVITLGDPALPEEGHVKPYAAVKTPDGRLHADEVVVRWDGWSLAVPFVNLLGGTPLPEPAPATTPPYVFRWDFSPVGGALPRLRFVVRYAMRVRIADLTGGGPGLDEPTGPMGATGTVKYARSDPIRPPRLSHDNTFGAGAALDRLVVRSDLGMNAARFSAAHPQYPPVERRALHRPTVSFGLAEQHGVFDPREGNPDDAGPAFTERTWKLALRALRAEAADDPDGALPDPATSGVSAHVAAAPGGLTEPLTDRSAWDDWPSADPKRITLSDQPTPTPPIALAWANGDLDLRLAKAEEAVLELSSTVTDGFLDHFSVKQWLDRPVSASGVPLPDSEWEVTVLNGRHPVLCPVRRIHLVHAVRRPLAEPRWQSRLTGFSEPPGTSADLGASVLLVPYAVTRDGDRWYADIEIAPPAAAPSYAPFVRLALARFQRNSLPRMSLSPVVVADPVRLLPDRRLIVERTGPDLRISLLGTGPRPPNRLEAVLEEAHGPAGAVPGVADLVDLGSPAAATVPAWRPLSARVTSDSPETPSVLRMPSGTAPLRLRVREVERIPALPPSSAGPAELQDRTLFVDVVPLPPGWRPG
ncbi:hypothetical protein [Streptomyces sp. NPDC020951]|uniref:hypothetical protein n=1 Tax=Streptomyces sp. NPDC020951 TaxID=3365104 RepID=UPI0037A8F886